MWAWKLVRNLFRLNSPPDVVPARLWPKTRHVNNKEQCGIKPQVSNLQPEAQIRSVGCHALLLLTGIDSLSSAKNKNYFLQLTEELWPVSMYVHKRISTAVRHLVSAGLSKSFLVLVCCTSSLSSISNPSNLAESTLLLLLLILHNNIDSMRACTKGRLGQKVKRLVLPAPIHEHGAHE